MRNFRACAVRLLAFATVGAFFAAPAMAQTKPPLRIGGCFSAYVKAYRARFNEDPSFFAGTAYDAFVAVRQAVRRSGSIEPAGIRDALDTGNDFVGVTGRFRMNETDHVGLGADSMRIVQVRRPLEHA